MGRIVCVYSSSFSESVSNGVVSDGYLCVDGPSPNSPVEVKAVARHYSLT